jgi:hypothetical protein
MKKIAQTIILSLTLAAVALPTIDTAFARDPYPRVYDDNYQPRRKHHHTSNADAAIVGGVLGLAAGAIIGGALQDNHPRRQYIDPPVYDDPEPVYVQPRRVYVQPRRVYQQPVVYGTLEPWTRDWFEYCSQRYRSFNPNTGTYRGYDSMDHFCTAE